jgi:hypothetical protein
MPLLAEAATRLSPCNVDLCRVEVCAAVLRVCTAHAVETLRARAACGCLLAYLPTHMLRTVRKALLGSPRGLARTGFVSIAVRASRVGASLRACVCVRSTCVSASGVNVLRYIT